MHEFFADWYRAADPGFTRETLTMRWAATEELQQALTNEFVCELATFITRSQRTAPADLTSAYKRHDAAMLTKGIDFELRVLAGMNLRLAMKRDDDLASVAALSLLCGLFGQKNQASWLIEHASAATTALRDAAINVRAFPETISINQLEIGEVNEALSEAVVAIDNLRETNDLLWWAISDFSTCLDTPYHELEPGVIPIAAATDLFEIARIVPVTSEAEMLLIRTVSSRLDNKSEFSLKNYLSSLSRDQAKSLATDLPEECSVLCPVLFATTSIRDAKPWLSELDKQFGVKSTGQHPGVAIAIQLLRERMLVHFLTD